MAGRFCEELGMLDGVGKETRGFLTHLYEKTKGSLERIVDEYREKLDQFYLENK